MAEPKLIPFGPWELGFVNSVEPSMLKETGLTRAENVDINLLGVAKSRDAVVVLPEVSLADQTRLFTVVGGTPIDTQTGEIVLGNRYTLLNNQFVGITNTGLINAPAPVLKVEADDDRLLSVIPGGRFIEAWNGRLLIARGTSLLYSEAFNYSTYDPMRNFVSFPQQITWLAALTDCVYVGTRSFVYVLLGADPAEWVIRPVDGPSWEGVGGRVNTQYIKPLQAQENAGQAACWFTSRGFVFGNSQGKIIAPQEERLVNLPLGSGRLLQFNDRLWALPL